MKEMQQERRYESDGFSEENLPQVQDRAAQGRGASDLLRSAPQTASRMSESFNTLTNQI
jgi:hypothetical protein